MSNNIAIILFIVTCLLLGADTAPPLSVQVSSGTASFLAPTNVPGIEVKGNSGALTANAEVLRNKDNLLVQRMDARIPVNSLATGMKIRDEHMRKFIFTTPGGDTPDIRFTSEQAACTAISHGYACQIAGQLALRGIARPFSMNLRVKEQDAESFRAEGDGLIKLGDYGIEPPSQLGVKPVSDVKFHVGFLAKGRTAEGAK